MTHEEAIKVLGDAEFYTKHDADYAMAVHDAITIAKEAIKKQIPMKPEGDGFYSPYYCPSCGEKLSEHAGYWYYEHYYEWTYCHNEKCLQRIKWE